MANMSSLLRLNKTDQEDEKVVHSHHLSLADSPRSCCECGNPKKKTSKKGADHEAHDNISTAMLTVSTFASAITFNIILKPSDGDSPALALLYLSYANALFCGAIMGCVLIKISIELCKTSLDYVGEWKEHVKGLVVKDPIVDTFIELGVVDPIDAFVIWLSTADDAAQMMTSIGHWILGVETTIVGAILFVAIYFLFLSCKFFLEINGPFLAGTIIYAFFGGITVLLALILMSVGHWMRRRETETQKGKHMEERLWILRLFFKGIFLLITSYLPVLFKNLVRRCHSFLFSKREEKTESAQALEVSNEEDKKQESSKENVDYSYEKTV